MIRVAKFSLATSESYKDDKGQMQVNTEWHSIILWRGLAGLPENIYTRQFGIYRGENKDQKS